MYDRMYRGGGGNGYMTGCTGVGEMCMTGCTGEGEMGI